MNNLALFVIHKIFLTKEQIETLLNKNSIEVIGHCVVVWVDAKTGKTTEPASEIFCYYKINNSEENQRDIVCLKEKGFEIFLPNKIDWEPPPEIDFEKMSKLTSEERQDQLKERDKWWFGNPKPPDVSNLKFGYLRFEIKKIKQKIKRKEYSSQHVIEISTLEKLEKSLTV